MFTPPYSPLHNVPTHLRQRGYAIVAGADILGMIRDSAGNLHDLNSSWNHLHYDIYLKDGGRYRKRRHSSFALHNHGLELVDHRAHWQPIEYNALHGGMQRWFEPISDAVLQNAAWRALITRLANLFEQAPLNEPWFVEAHQFRIDTEGGLGHPTPEGAHRDGVDFVAVFLIQRQDIKGGETRIFEANGPYGQRFTLDEPWSVLLLDDARMIHETTPIQSTGPQALRDTLVLTYKRGGFIGVT
jgi:hypothetical protein